MLVEIRGVRKLRQRISFSLIGRKHQDLGVPSLSVSGEERGHAFARYRF